MDALKMLGNTLKDVANGKKWSADLNFRYKNILFITFCWRQIQKLIISANSPANSPVCFPRKRTIFVMWQRVHYIISTVPCAKLLTSIKRTLIHLIVILNGVYIARMANIYINIVKEATSHERGGDSACFFFQWLIDTPPKACSIKTRARLKRNWLSVNVDVCLNGFISQTDKGYANSPARRCPILEPPMPNPSNAKC